MNKKDRLFLKENYGRFSEKYLTGRLGVSLGELRCEAFLLGLSVKASSPRKKTPKPDTRRRSAVAPSPAPTVDLIPVRIDARTVILIPPDADPEERRRRFFNRTTTPPKRGVAVKKSQESAPEEITESDYIWE